MKKLAIIGGSGIYKLDSIKVINEFVIDTPFGDMSAPVMEMEYKGHQFYFISRHGEGHSITPSEINYRANIFGLKKIGVDTVVSISAVGSLKEEHAPGDFVVVDQFVDWTKGLRRRTFFDEGVVGHVSVANPVSFELKERVSKALAQTSIKYSESGTYICIEGPQFSSKAESNIYRSFGADVIGMTNVPESYLAKEAGIAYSTVAMVTDYDCWKDEHCTVEEIMKVMGGNYIKAQEFIEKIVPDLVSEPLVFEAENKYAIVTNPELISAHANAVNEILLQ